MAATPNSAKTARVKAPQTAPKARLSKTAAAKPAKASPQPYDTPLFAAAAPQAGDIVAAADKALALLAELRKNLAQVIFGQDKVVEQVLTALLAGGHALLVGVPGLAKTKLVETLGIVLSLDEKRIQFTPDLMPADIIGSEVMEEDAKGRRSFRYIQGPVFAQLLMGDEINRASPRTQAALLQAMQEYHVTIAGKRYDLPRPFHVLATQNPLEQEGTYPLPEAQLDRFLMQIDISYPDRETEKHIALATTGAAPAHPQAALVPARLVEMQELVRYMPMPENVLNAIVTLVRACRPPEEEETETIRPAAALRAAETGQFIAWGPGPRATQALSLCVRARALLQGRLAPAIADVRALACPVLQHRMALNFAARAANIRLTALIDNLAGGLE
ncbi:AAA family ATPase [Candidatus Tokpelaia sp.]|uniref:AAA family ATPase n=1 Tax=Candidatus Tokpelaia sp. TaxID=2233777 RepID=UPI00123B28D3|nr:MoxR family ATPase [Candidatus Tokpelaia sp.]KAA6405828.1 AAA family ATPase [Candidatus Tokpelaia sp.]